MNDNLALEVRNITKRFPGVIANDQVNFNLRKGEVHALLGENGAGKSTLMNVIYGLYSQDEGEFFIDGQKLDIRNPHDAIDAGIGMVHQHFMLVPIFSVVENIVLGSETTRGPSLDLRTARRQVRQLSQEFGLEIDPEAIVEDLPVGVQQRVEIIKALYRQAKILVLDEPTAVLTPQEADDLFRIMRQLTERGVSIIFITHKLREVLAVADRITVMRRGKVVGSAIPAEIDEPGLAALMVGREVLLEVEKEPADPKEVVLDVKNLVVNDDRGLEIVRDVSFQVREGEILGIAGVQGNGQTELIEALSGLGSAQGGTISLDGHQMPFGDPRVLIETGQSHIPEDRHKHGLVMPYTIADNMVLCTYYKPPFAQGLQRDEQAVLENSQDLVAQYDVRTPSPIMHASTLSGGNQQKMIVARELSRPIRLLIANQPTRGLDVGSIEYIHRQIIEMRDQGIGVLLVSAELDEIMSLADRISVMYHGKIVATVEPDKVSKGELGLLMAGSEASSNEDIQ
jgi:simple sugar transport system ATP-binding protein